MKYVVRSNSIGYTLLETDSLEEAKKFCDEGGYIEVGLYYSARYIADEIGRSLHMTKDYNLERQWTVAEWEKWKEYYRETFEVSDEVIAGLEEKIYNNSENRGDDWGGVLKYTVRDAVSGACEVLLETDSLEDAKKFADEGGVHRCGLYYARRYVKDDTKKTVYVKDYNLEREWTVAEWEKWKEYYREVFEVSDEVIAGLEERIYNNHILQKFF